MRNITVCEKCKEYYCHATARPGDNHTMIPYFKYYCQIDSEGLEKTASGVKFQESNVLLEEFIKLECPKNCPYKLEHIVIKGE